MMFLSQMLQCTHPGFPLCQWNIPRLEGNQQCLHYAFMTWRYMARPHSYKSWCGIIFHIQIAISELIFMHIILSISGVFVHAHYAFTTWRYIAQALLPGWTPDSPKWYGYSIYDMKYQCYMGSTLQNECGGGEFLHDDEMLSFQCKIVFIRKEYL